MEGISGMHSLTKELADIFAEESENDRTFHGFSENEIDDLCDHNASFENGLEDVPEPSLNETKTSSKRPGAQQFTLRVALRLRSHTPHSSEEDTEGRNNEENEYKEDMINKKPTTIRRTRHIKCEEEEKSLAPPPASLKSGSGSEDDATDCFLTKRDQNIKANKAMLSQLMADLQKIPEAAGFLKKHSTKKTKPRAYVKPTRNPERATRRQTRSMGGGEGSSGPQETELELSLEEELLEVRHAPQRRGTPRPNQTKPHVMRPVEEITEDELQLVADNMTEKVYNRVTGTTCHQCRQKTIDTKTCCRSEDCRGIQGQFCGPCLRNRYGEDVKKALLDPEWQCPPCRGICNCSFCRAREGRCPTGILFPLAQYHGFSDVHSYLSSLRNKLKNGEEDADL